MSVGELASPSLAEMDPILCRCLQITESVIRQTIESLSLDTQSATALGEVCQRTGAGSGCMACRLRIARLMGLPAESGRCRRGCAQAGSCG